MKILVVQTGFLGDVVLSSAVLGNLAKIYPEAEISVLTTPQAEPLVHYHRAVSQTIVYAKRGRDRGLIGLLKMSKRLREEEFDIAFSLHKSTRTSALLRLAGIPIRYGFAESSLPWLYSKTVTRSELSHDVLRNLAILRCVGFEPGHLDQQLEIGVPQEVKGAVADMIPANANAVGIAPGSVWPTKRWATEGFADVARAFANRGQMVVLIGGPEDRAVSQEIESLVNYPLLNLVGKVDILTSVAVVSRLKVLVTNDSAPLHFASAVGTPVVALFCATVPEFGFGPWQVPAKVLGVGELSCRPCGTHGGRTCPTGSYACKLNLSSDAVIAAAESLLQSEEEYCRAQMVF